MAPETRGFQPDTLWSRVQERTAHAIQSGILQSIQTECEIVEEEGVNFLIRIIMSLARKDEAKKVEKKKQTFFNKEQQNPFLPYDQDLFVADVSDTHVCLLNKFNVIDHHILIVTRSFEDQESLLTLQDFQALWICMAEYEALMFYNAGEKAGASQQHKHMQIVPLPLVPGVSGIPIESIFESARFQGSIGNISALPFVHAIARVDARWIKSPLEAAESTLEHYRNMLRAVSLFQDAKENGEKSPGTYNLLVTRHWMLLVPRSRECYGAISVNALGFAGALLVRNEEQLRAVKEAGPMNVLRWVAVTGVPGA